MTGLLRIVVIGVIGVWLMGATSAVAQDARAFTENEVDILQNLARRQAEIEQLEAALDARESEMVAIERRIDGKIAGAGRLRCEIFALVREVRDREEKRQLKLVKMYESMKPKLAARIFNDMDTVLVGQIALGMKDRKLSKIMEKMRADTARGLTTLLARLRAEELGGETDRPEPALVGSDRCGDV